MRRLLRRLGIGRPSIKQQVSFPYTCPYCQRTTVADGTSIQESSSLNCRVFPEHRSDKLVAESECSLRLVTITCKSCGKASASVRFRCLVGKMVRTEHGELPPAAVGFHHPLFP